MAEPARGRESNRCKEVRREGRCCAIGWLAPLAGSGKGRTADLIQDSRPFKASAARRRRIPKQKCRLTNWAAYDASLRQRGSLTIWFGEGDRRLAREATDNPRLPALVFAAGDPGPATSCAAG